jgi:hypothetical protein
MAWTVDELYFGLGSYIYTVKQQNGVGHKHISRPCAPPICKAVNEVWTAPLQSTVQHVQLLFVWEREWGGSPLYGFVNRIRDTYIQNTENITSQDFKIHVRWAYFYIRWNTSSLIIYDGITNICKVS